ncbi:probable asparagine--tRNA ligase, mitochondrial [Galendromus occidentalis]|uniref:asparagine--tRNA ligase n=1 Tax=Galendromus occidentalis TaxID=34638 RepID=A0AAJ7SH72_9ACAR|nr:probable asparagine--tRNA ligase, mitochondrial [Galendromus occidentalis]
MFNHLRRSFSTLRTPIHRLSEPQKDVTLLCWVRTLRKHKDVVFADLSDGLSPKYLQAVFDAQRVSPDLGVGCSLKVTGDLVESQGKSQRLELVPKTYEIIGKCNLVNYPFRPRREYPVAHERAHLHLRPRLRKFAALHRIRNDLTQSMHSFFQELDFCHIQTPIITSNDCEGAGEVFSISHPNDPKEKDSAEEKRNPSYFPSRCHLTVSAQLHLEALVHSISRVYTVQPAFRAENALSRKHLCEFAMLEAELTVENLDELVRLSEGLIKHCWQAVRTSEDLKALKAEEWRDKLDEALQQGFLELSYGDAIKELKGRNFECPIEWGDDFKVEHEEFLVATVSKGRPVVVTRFPAKLKPFYMEKSGETAECFDVLVPIGGEIVGGSLRETDLETLGTLIDDQKIEGLDWYLDLREYGSIPHGGFGLGIDRLMQYFTNTNSIKEIVAFPRWERHCQA